MGFGTNRNAVVVCIALVVLAGCSGGSLDDGASAAYTTSGEELNGTQLGQDHVERLESAGSFTAVIELHVESGGTDARFDQATAVNLTADRARERGRISANGSVGDVATDRYTDGDDTLERLTIGSGDDATVRYRQGDGVTPVNATSAMRADLATEAAESINWTQTGVVERNGTTLTRYVATGRENFTNFRGTDLGTLDQLDTNATDATTDSMNATLLVSSNGLVREFRFSFAGTADGEPAALQFTVRTTDVGTTDAAPPDWLDEAKAQTGS